MIIKKCDKCGAEIHDFPETNVEFPRFYIYKYESGLQKIDINLCNDCVKKFDEWLKEKTSEDIQNKIATLEAKNEHLRNEILLNESFNEAITLAVKNELNNYENQNHWFRNLVKKVFRKR